MSTLENQVGDFLLRLGRRIGAAHGCSASDANARTLAEVYRPGLNAVIEAARVEAIEAHFNAIDSEIEAQMRQEQPT